MRGRTSAPDQDRAFNLLILDVFDGDELADGEADDPSLRKAAKSYARILATYGGARVTHTVRLNAPEGDPPTAFYHIIKMHERIKKYTNQQTGSLPENDELIAFGSKLFDALFQGKVRDLYNEARARNADRKLDLILTSMIPWLAEKPWEFAYDARRDSFLATEDVHFIRNALTTIPADEVRPSQECLQILVAAAQPVGYGQLSTAQEIQIIRREFKDLVDAGLASIDVLAHATPQTLQDQLRKKRYGVLHFIGHGVFEDGEGKLIFENEKGRGGDIRLGERAVRELVCRRGLNLVFLNSCQSASGSLSEFNRGLAQSLVAHGLPALVANQYSVLDSSAASFSNYFYRALAQGHGIGQAACEARIAVNCSMQGDIIDWAVPVVYARDPGLSLCSLPPPPAPAGRAKRGRAARETREPRATRRLRIAVWDMDGAFPALAETLQRMTAAQDAFEFEVVSLSTPLDIWDSDPPTPDKTGRYLRAEKLARRIDGRTAQLGVDILTCISRHWMRDADTLNLYGWWDERQRAKVLIFSCAGFERLPPEGRTTDRVIANITVSGLAGYLGALGAHEAGAADCPLDHNPERDFERIAGRQKFEASCRATVLQKLGPEKLGAFEKLLKLFHGR